MNISSIKEKFRIEQHTLAYLIWEKNKLLKEPKNERKQRFNR